MICRLLTNPTADHQVTFEGRAIIPNVFVPKSWATYQKDGQIICVIALRKMKVCNVRDRMKK
jgi:hypothetical protein